MFLLVYQLIENKAVYTVLLLNDLLGISVNHRISLFSESVRATPAGNVNLVEINKFLAIHLTHAKDRLANRSKSSERFKASNMPTSKEKPELDEVLETDSEGCEAGEAEKE